MTSLIYACHSTNVDLIKKLLEKGSNVDIKDKKGWTAFMYASAYGLKDIVKLLIDNERIFSKKILMEIMHL